MSWRKANKNVYDTRFGVLKGEGCWTQPDENGSAFDISKKWSNIKKFIARVAVSRGFTVCVMLSSRLLVDYICGQCEQARLFGVPSGEIPVSSIPSNFTYNYVPVFFFQKYRFPCFLLFIRIYAFIPCKV